MKKRTKKKIIHYSKLIIKGLFIIALLVIAVIMISKVSSEDEQSGLQAENTSHSTTAGSTMRINIEKESEETEADEGKIGMSSTKGIENMDELNKLAKNVVDSVVNPDDPEADRIYSVFWWEKTHMKFIGSSDKSSWINEAIKGFKKGNGDCFTFFAMMKAMLGVMGYDTIDVVRVGGESHHYWSMIKYQGEWYHIDSCPRGDTKDKYWYCFLRTNDELEAWLEKHKNDDAAGYYNFDRSAYPETGTEPLNLGWLQHH